MAHKYIYLVKIAKNGKEQLFRFLTDQERQFFLSQLRKRDTDAHLELSISSLDVANPPCNDDKKQLGQKLVNLAESLRIYAAHQELQEMLQAAEVIANETV